MKKLHTVKLWFSALPKRSPRPLHSAAMSDLLENETRHSVLMVLLRGTTIMTALFVLLLLVSIFISGNTFVWLRAVMGTIALVYLIAALLLAHRARQRSAAYMLVVFYVVVANISAAMWGVAEPFALLMMLVTVVLAGFLLGSRFSLYLAVPQAVVLVVLQLLVEHDAVFWTHGTFKPVLLGDVVGYGILFIIVGLITWLFGRQVERTLRRAWQAERDLQVERDQLEVRLQERTESLRALQLEEMKQLYRFAELGQMSTALLHDLANRLTTLTLDIEDLGGKRRTGAIERARQSIGYLDELVGKVSMQLHEQREAEPFNVLESLREVKTNLHARLQKSGVKLTISHEGEAPSRLVGDALRFSQVMTILLGNAIDAAAESEHDKRVEVTVQGTSRHVEILVHDWGNGIAQADHTKIFTPFYTTKDNGMGIGLFIAREIMETHFKGSVTLDHAVQPTTFHVILPHEGDGHDGQKGSKRAKNKRKPTK
jgi:signal transduction histidine kinase